MLKQFLKHSALYTIGSGMYGAVPVVLAPVLAHCISREDNGVIDILLIVTLLVRLTVALEITQGIARFYAEGKTPDAQRRYASTALWFALPAYAIFGVLVYIAAAPVAQLLLDTSERAGILRLAAFAMIGEGVFYHLQNQLKWQRLPKIHAACNAVYAIIIVTATYTLLAVSDFGIKGIYWAIIAGTGCSSVCAWFGARQNYGFLFDREKLVEMLRFSAPLVPSGIAIFVAGFVDRFFIKEMLTLDDNGIYGMAYRFALVIGLAVVGVQGALTPLVYHHYKEPGTPENIVRILRFFLAALLPIFLALALFSPELLQLFTGPAYYAGASLIPLLAASLVVSRLYLFAPGLSIAKLTIRIAVINVIAAILNCILNYVLIRAIGLPGAAVATLISALLACVAYFVLGQPHYRITYPWGRLGTAAGVAVVLALMPFITCLDFSPLAGIAIKLAMLIGGTLVIVFVLDLKNSDNATA